MRKYNGLPPIAVLALAVLAAGCASSSTKTGDYPVEVPPEPEPTITRGSVEMPRPAPRLREDAPLRYVVKKGDTLWDIANRFLRDAWQWPEIWYVNDKIKNPHLIYPGDVLTLIYVDGRPQLIAETGVSMGGEGRSGRLSPEVRSEPLTNAIPAIPMEAIVDFLQKTRVVDPETLKTAPYIIDFGDPRVVGGAGNMAYVKNLVAGPNAAFSVVRLGQKFRDPSTGEELGWEAIPVGDAEVQDFAKISTITLVRSVREVRVGDQLIEPEQESFDAFFYPKLPPKPVEGRIISALDSTGQIGQYSIVTLNRGAREGLDRGDVFTIMESGRTARDPHQSDRRIALPDAHAGTMMVFKVHDKVSYALVLSASREIGVLDRFVTPTSLR